MALLVKNMQHQREILQLNSNSLLQLQSTNALTTGLQNTVRVAFALYEADGSVATDFDGDGTVGIYKYLTGKDTITLRSGICSGSEEFLTNILKYSAKISASAISETGGESMTM